MPQKDSKIFQYSFLKLLMDIKRAASDNEPNYHVINPCLKCIQNLTWTWTSLNNV